RVVGERREAAVVAGAEALGGDVLRRGEHAVADLFGRFDARVDRVGDADEDPLVGLDVLGDYRQRDARVTLAGELDVDVADLQVEQGRQQARVFDVQAVHGILVPARAGVYADPGAFLGGEPVEHGVVEVDELPQQPAGRVQLQRQAAFGEVDLHTVRTGVEAAPDVGLGLVHQIGDERFLAVPVDPVAGVDQRDRG